VDVVDDSLLSAIIHNNGDCSENDDGFYLTPIPVLIDPYTEYIFAGYEMLVQRRHNLY
jgi:hypothetical protein